MPILPDVSARPLWRGRTHAWAFVAAVIGGAALVAAAPDGRARLALGIYAATVAGLFGVSAVYHRVRGARRRRARGCGAPTTP